MIAAWLKKYGSLVALVTAVAVFTTFLVRFDASFKDGNKKLGEMSEKMTALSKDVEVLKISVQMSLLEREKYDRWRRGFNARMKRAFNQNGWEYDEVE